MVIRLRLSVITYKGGNTVYSEYDYSGYCD